MGEEVLSELRKKIDRVDEEILRLLSKRAETVLEVGKLKSKESLPTYLPKREREILERLAKKNDGSLPESAVTSIFKEIISGCRALERDFKVAYLGPEGTFSQMAALLLPEECPSLLAAMNRLGTSPTYVATRTIRSVFEEVSHGRADLGVVPIENSTVGTLFETLDPFVEFDLKICAEIYLTIHHHLLAMCPLNRVQRIYSKDTVFEQCKTWLEDELPRAQWVDVDSTTQGVERAKSEEGSAAIASRLASETLGLPVLVENIEDDPDNMTRFFIIGGESEEPTGRDKTSVMVALKDKVGALYDILYSFKSHQINLTKIESRPSRRKPWDYYFFLDFQGHWKEEATKAALSEMSERAMFVKWLGSYIEGDKG